MNVLSVDPGDKRVGWALWTESGELKGNGILDPDKFLSMLIRTNGLSTIITEDWRLRKERQKAGRPMLSSEVIGMLRYHAEATGCALIRQNPGILRITAMHADIKLPKGHIPDDVSAYLHGYWFFESAGILAPKPLDER